MKIKAASGIMLTLLLVSMLTLAFNIQMVKATGTIYIRADGSVEPEGTPISSIDNITYTFTDNIYDEIVVERDNIVVDGAGYTLQGTGSGTGIHLSGRNNVTIKDMEIKVFSKGIWLWESSNITVLGNNITNNGYFGIQLVYSDNSIVIGNRLTNDLNGIAVEDSEAITVQNNTIEHSSNLGIHLIFSADCIITNNRLKYYNMGVSLDVSTGNRISQNTMRYGYIGIEIAHSGDNSINRNKITNNQWGLIVELYRSSNNILRDNTISNSSFQGIRISYWANNNTIYNNTVTSNAEGILVSFSNNSVIVYNTISENNLGIKLGRSSSNVIHHNNFMDNIRQARAWDNTTIWDDGYPSGGNYWSDHVTVDDYSGIDQDEPGSDGIVDDPYIIDDYNRDNYPLAPPTVVATADVVPNTLNLRSVGEWITCYIELPEGYNVSEIDISTVMLNDTIPVSLLDLPAPEPVPTEIGDYDNDTIPDLMVKFSRTEVASWIFDDLGIQYGNVTLTITGELFDGTLFEGTDTVKVLFPGDVDGDGDIDGFDFGTFAVNFGRHI